MILHSQDNMNIVQLSIKRIFDVIVSFFGMIVLSPLYLILALWVKLKGKGSVIVSQECIGRQGEPFNLYTFRDISHLNRLPQLWNILRGDMSFVGPCPHTQQYIDQISDRTSDYAIVLQMRPGLTSEASLYNGASDTIDKILTCLDLDIRYYRQRTLRLDLSILLDSMI